MRLRHILLAVLLVSIWGFNFVVIKFGLAGIPPILLVCSRFFLTSLPLVFFIKRPEPFGMVAWYGLVMFAMQFSFLFSAIDVGVTPGLASLLIQVQVFFTLLFAVTFTKESVRLPQVLGALLSFGGIILISMNSRGVITLSGFWLIMLAAISWAVGNIISKKIGQIDVLSLVVWGSLIAWPLLLLAALVIEGPKTILDSISNLTISSIASVGYITYLSTLFGFVVWNWLLRHYSLAVVAPFTLLVPMVALFSSVVLLGEPLENWKIVAAFLIVSGVGINQLASRYPKPFK